MKLKIIDKYLIKQFIQTTLFAILTFVLLFIVINAMERLDSFIDHRTSLLMIMQYYLYFTPEIINLILPIAVLLSCLFTVGKMSNLNELTAIKAGGVSLFRYMRPFLVVSFIFSIFLIFFGGYIVPEANKKQIYFEQHYLGLGYVVPGVNIVFQDSNSKIVTISNYDTEKNLANDISIQEFAPDDPTHMVSRIDASSMTYTAVNKSWNLGGVIKREFTGNAPIVTKMLTLRLSNLNFLPKDIINKQRTPEEMTLSELASFASDQRKAGNDPTATYIELHSRIAFSFSTIIVVLFGLPLSANKRKGGLALQIGLNLIIAFTYLVFMKVSQAFGKNGVMDPVSTAWFANAIFLIAAVINIRKAT